jgi:uncharacterized protein YjbJ (UPF0337 family)
MNTGTKDEEKGKFHEVKGTAKELAGELMNSPDLEAEGKKEKRKGKTQKKIGQIKKVFGK